MAQTTTNPYCYTITKLRKVKQGFQKHKIQYWHMDYDRTNPRIGDTARICLEKWILNPTNVLNINAIRNPTRINQ